MITFSKVIIITYLAIHAVCSTTVRTKS